MIAHSAARGLRRWFISMLKTARASAAVDTVASNQVELSAIKQAGRWKTSAMVGRYIQHLEAKWGFETGGTAGSALTFEFNLRPHVSVFAGEGSHQATTRNASLRSR
jgi:hypothetical protein